MKAAGMLLLVVLTASCARSPASGEPPITSNQRVALTDLGSGNYLGFTGGLYPGGSNTAPAAHVAEGVARARRIKPLDVNGNPGASGKYVLLSIGMSNTTQEFCSGSSNLPCDTWSFMGKAAADPAVNKTTLAIVNGAMGGQTAASWDAPADANYDVVSTNKLEARGLSEKQVQIVWVKVAQASPRDSLPHENSDAYQLVREQGAILRALKLRYPNVQQVFMSSRIYGGYATTQLNPEPYAYQGGFAVKWTIEAQITEMTSGAIDARAGTLNYAVSAPWVAWGPYLWADGMRARADGLKWELSDFVTSDRTHPSEQGRAKVAGLLLDFFKTSQFTRCWFLAGQTC